jgi:endonuclease/exonuclease/phosphatase (EEP) superfamily protein YafD
MRGAALLRVSLALCALVFVVRFVPHLAAATLQEEPGATHVNVLTWNVHVGGVSGEEMRRTILASGAGVVALQEAEWEWVDRDVELAEAYPYRLVRPNETAPGLVLLSQYPILEHGAPQPVEGTWVVPRRLWARLDLGDGRTLVVLNVHPFPPNAGPHDRDCAGLFCYETASRDAHIRGIREFIEPLLEGGERVLLLGDHNVTDREPAYLELAEGLQDAHKKIGAGLGNTWGIGVLKRLDVPLLRIDYLFSSPNVDPVRMSIDCAYRGSDHCTLHGRFEIE